MAQRRGADFRVLMALAGDGNGAFFAVNRIHVSAEAPPIETSNTEGVPGNPNGPGIGAQERGFSSTLGDIHRGRMRLSQATFDDNQQNPWSTPFGIAEGDYVEITAYPNGNQAQFGYDYGNCLVVSITHEGSVPGPQPITIEVQTDGFYERVGLT
jgi:hypothetical protein